MFDFSVMVDIIMGAEDGFGVAIWGILGLNAVWMGGCGYFNILGLGLSFFVRSRRFLGVEKFFCGQWGKNGWNFGDVKYRPVVIFILYN